MTMIIYECTTATSRDNNVSEVVQVRPQTQHAHPYRKTQIWLSVADRLKLHLTRRTMATVLLAHGTPGGTVIRGDVKCLLHKAESHAP